MSLPPRPARLFADPTRLEQVLVNLLNNAAKYTERGGRIRLSAELSGEDAVVRIRDDGVGIPADLLPRVFDLFVQGDRSLDRSQGGLGIGLTLVKRLVEMHGGAVEAHSEGVRRGSEFVVRLPLARGQAAAPESGHVGGEHQAPGREGARAQAGPRRRVLLVEDNVDAASTLGDLLTMWGHDVCLAPDGEDAVRAAATFHPHVALVDIGLPGMDGYEVARRLRRVGEKLILIGITGYGQEQDRSRSLAAGFDHHLVKPPDPDILRGLLAQRE